jgi:hypothetical protein
MLYVESASILKTPLERIALQRSQESFFLGTILSHLQMRDCPVHGGPNVPVNAREATGYKN